MLSEVSRNPRAIAVPVIDPIEPTDFHRTFTSLAKIPIGGFDWNLELHLIVRKARKKMRKKELVKPFSTPVLTNGIFAVNRNWFFDVGAFDPEMENFYGEGNLELSIRAWLCGGEILVCPCSHVGHVRRHVYKTSGWVPGDEKFTQTKPLTV